MEKKENILGALWIKESSKGQFLSGYIEVNGEKIHLVCFQNKFKAEDKHPDWIILKSKPKNNNG